MSNLQSEEYLDEKVRVIFDPMIIEMFQKKPNNPVINELLIILFY